MGRTAALIVIVAILACVSGCAHEPEGKRPASELFEEGASLAREGKVEKAAEAFMKVRTYYPSDELARRALLATADLYFDTGDYASALKSYQEYRLLYPTDAQAGYCLFRIGMCHFNQMSTYDRDQTETNRAVTAFESFLAAYPSSPHVEMARACLGEARARLGQNMLSVGRFYLRKGNLEAACARFRAVREKYPEAAPRDELDELVARACSSGPARADNPADKRQ
ncbi:MAG TPA: outer membrane protein assembly factor BamD [Deltaproteobacteria bacterium]|nr:outer membrane protein assembly factor BamD [Deltaproteobacteria bacterium]